MGEMGVRSVTANRNISSDSDSDESVYSFISEQGTHPVLKERGLLDREMKQRIVRDVYDKADLDDLVSLCNDDDDYQRDIMGSPTNSASSKRQRNMGGTERRRRRRRKEG